MYLQEQSNMEKWKDGLVLANSKGYSKICEIYNLLNKLALNSLYQIKTVQNRPIFQGQLIQYRLLIFRDVQENEH